MLVRMPVHRLAQARTMCQSPWWPNTYCGTVLGCCNKTVDVKGWETVISISLDQGTFALLLPCVYGIDIDDSWAPQYQLQG
jgi:hypothetical protein